MLNLKERLFFLRQRKTAERGKVDVTWCWQRFHDIVDKLAETPGERAVKYAWRPPLFNSYHLPMNNSQPPETLTRFLQVAGIDHSSRLRVEAVCSFERKSNRSTLKFCFVKDKLLAIVSFNLFNEKPKVEVSDFSHYANSEFQKQAATLKTVAAIKKIASEINSYRLGNKANLFLQLAEFVKESPKFDFPKDPCYYSDSFKILKPRFKNKGQVEEHKIVPFHNN